MTLINTPILAYEEVKPNYYMVPRAISMRPIHQRGMERVNGPRNRPYNDARSYGIFHQVHDHDTNDCRDIHNP